MGMSVCLSICLSGYMYVHICACISAVMCVSVSESKTSILFYVECDGHFGLNQYKYMIVILQILLIRLAYFSF